MSAPSNHHNARARPRVSPAYAPFSHAQVEYDVAQDHWSTFAMHGESRPTLDGRFPSTGPLRADHPQLTEFDRDFMRPVGDPTTYVDNLEQSTSRSGRPSSSRPEPLDQGSLCASSLSPNHHTQQKVRKQRRHDAGHVPQMRQVVVERSAREHRDEYSGGAASEASWSMAEDSGQDWQFVAAEGPSHGCSAADTHVSARNDPKDGRGPRHKRNAARR